MLRIWLLGQFEVQVEGKRTVIPARAAQSLLAFLVLTAGTPHRREKLAGMLWPDMSDEGARRGLRHELWRLRKALGAHQTTITEYIRSEELAIQFNPNAEYWLDVAQLERAPAPDETIAEMIARVGLYRGELLPGFYDDWVGPERDRVQALFENRMDELVRRLVAEERWLTAIEWAERWIALGHTPEAAYRALMLAHSAQGETSKIALDYERCAEALREDLDIDPSNETRALYERLTRGEIASPAQLETTPTIFVQSSGTVTFLFSDIEGSTKLLDRLGPEYARLLAEHQDIIRAIGEKFHGHEIDTQGDSFFFAFFRAADAVAFAAESQRALATHQFPQDANVHVRMGLHTGEPMLARTGYVGMDVHRAARIGAAGHGGQVLLSPTTRALVENELPDGTTLRDLGEHKLKDLRYPVHIVQLTIDGLPADFPPLKSINTGSEPPAPGEPPFKGLEFFDEQDANLFFGREQLIEKLAREVHENRFLAVVVGASGSGKSSVVRAGLVPALKVGEGNKGNEGNWRVFVMTPTAHPLEALATVLTREESLTVTAQLMDDLAREPRSLHLFLRRMEADGRWQIADSKSSSAMHRTLLVVDQFEELFTLCHDDLEREQFIDNLVNALNQSSVNSQQSSVSSLQSPSLTLVLTIRADFYAHLAEYPELRDLVAKQQEYIGPMNAEELRRAIEEPAKRGHWEFEPGLVDLILRDVGDEPGALPLLSHALLETWKRRSGHLMTLKGYHDAGGVRGAIAHTAESTYQQLSLEQQNIARNIFVRLTELGEGTEDTRRRAEIGELETGDFERAQVRQVLTLLADARLITTSEHTAEVAHEALIREWPRLREWLNEDREGLKLHRALTEAANEWELLERDSSMLYRGARLAQAREFVLTKPNVLNAGERAFLDASEENAKREVREREEQRERELQAAQNLAAEQQARIEETNRANKRLRQRAVFLAGVVVLALLAAGAALFFLTQSNANLQTANEQRAEANTQRDAAQIAQAESDKQKRTATARELAANAVANLDVDPERSVLLALQAVDATKKYDGIVIREAEEALHRAVQESRVVHTFTGLTSVDDLAYSPDGKRLAARGNGMIRVFDTITFEEKFALPLDGPPNYVDYLWFNADGGQLATIDVPEETNVIVKIFDMENGQVVRNVILPIPRDVWWVSTFNNDFTRVAVGNADGTTTLWNLQSGELVKTFAGHSDAVTDVVFSQDNKKIATSSRDGTAKIWDVESGQVLVTFKGHAEAVNSIALSRDGTLAATGSRDHTAKIWDATNGTELKSLGADDWATNVEFSQDGSQLGVLSLSSRARIWDVNTGQELIALLGHTGGTWGLALDSANNRIATGGTDGTVRIWDIGKRSESIAVPTTGAVGGVGYLANVVFNPDGTRVAVGLKDGRVKVWDTTNGAEALTLLGEKNNVRVAFSPDGKWIGSASLEQTAKIWDAKTGQEQITFREHAKPVGMITFHPDGERVATGDDAGIIKIWKLRTGDVLQSFDLKELGMTGLTYGLDFSPDGERLAVSTTGGFASVLNLAMGQPYFKFQRLRAGFFDIVFSSDGTRVALAIDSPPGWTVLDAATGQELVSLGEASTGTDWIAYSKDGKYLATSAVGDNASRIWDAATGKELLTLTGGENPPFAVAFSPDGTRLAVVSNTEVRVYLLRVEDLVALAKTRVTRSLTQEECQKYLHVEECPK